MSKFTVREKRIYETLRNLTNLAVCFLKTIIPIFESTDKVLQSEKPLVHCLLSTFRKIMLCFVKPNLVKGASNLLDIAYDQSINQKEDKDLMFGSGTQCIDETIGKKEHIDFYMMMRNYFVNVCNYIVSEFPLRSEVLHHSEVADISKQKMAAWESITYFVKKFPILVNQREDESMHVAIDKLQEEFNEYLCMRPSV